MKQPVPDCKAKSFRPVATFSDTKTGQTGLRQSRTPAFGAKRYSREAFRPGYVSNAPTTERNQMLDRSLGPSEIIWHKTYITLGAGRIDMNDRHRQLPKIERQTTVNAFASYDQPINTLFLHGTQVHRCALGIVLQRAEKYRHTVVRHRRGKARCYRQGEATISIVRQKSDREGTLAHQGARHCIGQKLQRLRNRPDAITGFVLHPSPVIQRFGRRGNTNARFSRDITDCHPCRRRFEAFNRVHETFFIHQCNFLPPLNISHLRMRKRFLHLRIGFLTTYFTCQEIWKATKFNTVDLLIESKSVECYLFRMTEDDKLRYDVTSTLSRVTRAWNKLVREAIVKHGISPACAAPLAAIAKLGDGERQGLIAEDIGIEGPSLVRLIDQLCSCGLVERRDDPVDRRAKTLWLTEMGKSVTKSIEADLVYLRADILKDLPRADLEATLRVYAALLAGADTQQATPAGSNQADEATKDTSPPPTERGLYTP